MIRVNGTPLDNPTLGWIFRSGSVPYSGLEANIIDLRVAGRDGLVPVPATLGAPVWPLKVNTPPSGWEPLLALFSAQELVLTRTDRPTIEARARLRGSSPDRVFPRNEWIDATFLVEITEAYWRDKATTTTPITPLTSASVELSVFAGGSAPVSDAMIRIQGATTGVRVTDASGAWVTLPDCAAGQYVRFESKTGQCFRTTTDTWVGGTEISGLVDFGGPRGNFEITPVLAAGDPTSRVGKLTVTSATRASSSVAVRGKAAYIL
jgi:hypothetical protein